MERLQRGWRLESESDVIYKSFQFRDFVTAWGFMCQVALVAEKHNHHPNWSNVYGQVEVRLSTHDVGGLSDKDFDLASAIDDIAAMAGG